MARFGGINYLPHPRSSMATSKYTSQARRRSRSRSVVVRVVNEDVPDAVEGQSYPSVKAFWYADNLLVVSFPDLYGNTSFQESEVTNEPYALEWDMGYHDIVDPDTFTYNVVAYSKQWKIYAREFGSPSWYNWTGTSGITSEFVTPTRIKILGTSDLFCSLGETIVFSSRSTNAKEVLLDDNSVLFTKIVPLNFRTQFNFISAEPLSVDTFYQLFVYDDGLEYIYDIDDPSSIDLLLRTGWKYIFTADTSEEFFYDTQKQISLIHGVSFKCLSQTFIGYSYSVDYEISTCDCGDFTQDSPPDGRNWVGTNAGPFDPCKHLYAVQTRYGGSQDD